MERKNCDQCGTEFTARANQRFHSRTCQLDSYRGTKPEESRRRERTGFAWDPIRQAQEVKVKLPKREKQSLLLHDWKTAAIIPDIQFGYHWTTDGMDPFHSEEALAVMREIVVQERPNKSIFLGDVVDLPMFGKFRQYPSFVNTLQPTLDRAHEEIAIVSECSDETEYLSGNHDERIHNAVIDNLFAAAGVRVARKQSEPGDGFPALSIPNLLRLPELGVKYVGAYPAGATYLNDELACIHGRLLGNKKRSAAQEVVEDERVSVIFGHTHRASMSWKTRNTRGAARYTVAYSPGCLCRVDGTVPSTRGGIDVFGRPIKSWEDWRNGMAIVRYTDDGKFHIEDIPIIEGWAMRDSGEQYGNNVT
jgi:predicted phosphodiesterase